MQYLLYTEQFQNRSQVHKWYIFLQSKLSKRSFLMYCNNYTGISYVHQNMDFLFLPTGNRIGRCWEWS